MILVLCFTQTACPACRVHCNATISRGPGFDARARQEKEFPMKTVVCSRGSFVELSKAFRSLSGGDDLALASQSYVTPTTSRPRAVVHAVNVK